MLKKPMLKKPMRWSPSFVRMSVKWHGGGTICESDGAHGLQILEVHAEAGGGACLGEGKQSRNITFFVLQ